LEAFWAGRKCPNPSSKPYTPRVATFQMVQLTYARKICNIIWCGWYHSRPQFLRDRRVWQRRDTGRT
jgi:hypothetical protein